ncbi:hypothetical protein HMPREF0156_01817 [Bacteroidetes oral taxon 274 str. F0058]|nr:hypothetical protein HMPREF0156_01817 [Bacteroidetes oral taxon 274 str. F0058]
MEFVFVLSFPNMLKKEILSGNGYVETVEPKNVTPPFIDAEVNPLAKLSISE